MEHMKLAKMMPKGRSSLSPMEMAWAALRAEDQKKTNMYMEPSKAAEMKPRAMMRLSLRRIERVLLLVAREVAKLGLALSP